MSLLRISGVALAILAPVLLVGCQPAGEVQETAQEKTPSDEEAIKQRSEAFAEAWRQADAKGIAALFAENGDTISPDGQTYSGRAAIESRYRELFEGMYKGTQIAIATTSIRLLQPDVAVVDGSYEITGMKGPDGKEMAAVKGLYTNLAVKEGAEWHIACSRPMIPVKMPGTT
jgi:uncharacterized protein (TIGR02246 family)